MRRAIIPVLTALGLALAGAAAVTASPTDPALQKVGEARLKVMFWSIYDSRLYTENGRYEDGQRPLKLEIEYLMDISSRKLVERTAKEWEDMGMELPQREEWIEQLSVLFPDIVEGDTLSFQARSDGSATLFHNGARRGTINDAALVQAFLDIWLSKDTNRPELRFALIGAEER